MIQSEFEALMGDTTKCITGDISWSPNEDHSPAVEFRAEVYSEAGYPLFVKGYLNVASRKLTHCLIHRSSGAIYRLDLGKEHPNLDGQRVGEKHKHRWNEGLGLKDAYAPEDITASIDEPVTVWRQFCREAQMSHEGTLREPPSQQLDLWI